MKVSACCSATYKTQSQWEARRAFCIGRLALRWGLVVPGGVVDVNVRCQKRRSRDRLRLRLIDLTPSTLIIFSVGFKSLITRRNIVPELSSSRVCWRSQRSQITLVFGVSNSTLLHTYTSIRTPHIHSALNSSLDLPITLQSKPK